MFSNTYLIIFQYCNQACDVTKCGEFAVPESHLKPCKTCNSVGKICTTCLKKIEPIRDKYVFITAAVLYIQIPVC